MVKVSKSCNTNIIKVLRLTREMMVLADLGDESRQDKNCGILYGILRDAAYRIRSAAEEEKILHQKSGLWDIEEGTIPEDRISDQT